MAKEKFIFEKTVYLGDTNAEGNVYFARYFDWQGQAREAFYKKYFPIEIWNSGLKIITVNASIEYKQEAYLFDEISIEIKLSNLKQASAEMAFTFVNKLTGKLLASGLQKIAFADKSGKLIHMPEKINQIANSFIE
jgi:YbgC/YbaW family acyl-CoA thioester hydrolase